jgi:cyanate permease
MAAGLAGLLVGPVTGRIERRLGSRRQLLTAMTCVLVAYAGLVEAHATTLQLLVPTIILGLGLGLGGAYLPNRPWDD